MFRHLSPLASLLVSLLRHSWPDAFTLVSMLVSLLVTLVSTCLSLVQGLPLETLGRMSLRLSPVVSLLVRWLRTLGSRLLAC